MADQEQIPVHPVQTKGHRSGHPRAVAPQVVTMKAYEVYCKLYGKQEALVTGECRGGFSASELIAYLYAHSFPIVEWSYRVDEALRGMTV